MVYVDYDKCPRDCHNCGHAANRHHPIGKTLTMVCLLKARGVRPHELQETNTTLCGTAIDVNDRVVPRYWTKVSE